MHPGTKVNVRERLGQNRGYHAISREERNVAAILYHLLLQGSNLQNFLALARCSFPIHPDEYAIFFEYAYLRDLWNAGARDGEDTRAAVLDILRPPNADELRQMSILEFNRYFGATPHPSRTYIQMPGKWSIDQFAKNIHDNDTFLRTCRFKWAFNAKPDIVIHTSNGAALCIECKLESGEGQYPTKRSELEEFSRRGIAIQKQTDLQAHILRELLGLEAEFVLLVAKPTARSQTHRTVTWAECFSALDSSGCPSFMREWIRRIQSNG